MPATPALPLATDFTTIDFSIPNPTSITNNPDYEATLDPNVAYKAVSADNPTGIWAVGGQAVTAGQLVLAKLYGGYTSTEATIATHLSSMNINTKFANAASAFAVKIKAAAEEGATKTYADLVTMAGDHITGLNMTAQQFVTLVLPNESAGTTYTTASLKTVGNTVDQFANSKLTDNSVLQQKLSTATSNRNAILEAMTALMRSWNTFLGGLAKAL